MEFVSCPAAFCAQQFMMSSYLNAGSKDKNKEMLKVLGYEESPEQDLAEKQCDERMNYVLKLLFARQENWAQISAENDAKKQIRSEKGTDDQPDDDDDDDDDDAAAAAEGNDDDDDDDGEYEDIDDDEGEDCSNSGSSSVESDIGQRQLFGEIDNSLPTLSNEPFFLALRRLCISKITETCDAVISSDIDGISDNNSHELVAVGNDRGDNGECVELEEDLSRMGKISVAVRLNRKVDITWGRWHYFMSQIVATVGARERLYYESAPLGGDSSETISSFNNNISKLAFSADVLKLLFPSTMKQLTCTHEQAFADIISEYSALQDIQFCAIGQIMAALDSGQPLFPRSFENCVGTSPRPIETIKRLIEYSCDTHTLDFLLIACSDVGNDGDSAAPAAAPRSSDAIGVDGDDTKCSAKVNPAAGIARYLAAHPDIIETANSIDKNYATMLYFHKLLSHRLRGYLFCSWFAGRLVDKEFIYLANRLVFWRAPVDILVHDYLFKLLEVPEQLVGLRKQMTQQLLCWRWPHGFQRTQTVARQIVTILGEKLKNAYETVKQDGVFGKLLTSATSIQDFFQAIDQGPDDVGDNQSRANVLQLLHGSKEMRNQLYCWDVFGRVSKMDFDALCIPEEWGGRFAIDVRNLCCRDDPILNKTVFDRTRFYIAFLSLLATKLNPSFQHDMRAIYEEVKQVTDRKLAARTAASADIVEVDSRRRGGVDVDAHTLGAHPSESAEHNEALDGCSRFLAAPVKSLVRATAKEIEYRAEFKSLFASSSTQQTVNTSTAIGSIAATSVVAPLSSLSHASTHGQSNSASCTSTSIDNNQNSTDSRIAMDNPPGGFMQALAADNYAHFIIDWMRCAVVVRDAEEAVLLIRTLASKYKVCRIKNSLQQDNVNGSYGYRSVLVSIEYGYIESVAGSATTVGNENDKITRSDNPRMIAEVQIMLSSFYSVREKMHIYYKILRAENCSQLADDFLGVL